MLIDGFGRKIDYLRISVTDRCNLRCVYCMPAEGIAHKPHNEILSFEQIYRIASLCAGLGIEKIRITGGEPLARKDINFLIEKLKGISGLKEIALTSNGIYLKDCALSLKKSGLDRINISLDSLIPERFSEITRGGDLNAVLEGIEVSLSVGLLPVKINVVLIGGFNTDEILDFALLTEKKSVEVRFIEYMPTDLDNFAGGSSRFFSCKRAKEICGRLGELVPQEGKRGTAEVFRINGFAGRIGFISPISRPFCGSCNKLRLTSDGRLRSCLHSFRAVDLKSAVERNADDEELAVLIKEAAALKPGSHNLKDISIKPVAENFSMCQIGG